MQSDLIPEFLPFTTGCETLRSGCRATAKNHSQYCDERRRLRGSTQWQSGLADGSPPGSVPAGVKFVTESIGAFAERLRTQAGKNVWMMGGGEIIGSFLDEGAIDEFIITVVPTFIGEGIPLLAPKHREVPLRLLGVQQFPDGVVHNLFTGLNPSSAETWWCSGILWTARSRSSSA